MANDIAPDVLMNSVLGNINNVLLNGDGQIVPKSDDHYFAFMSPGIPMLEDSFNYAIEGFGGVARRNATIEKLDEAVGPQENTVDPAELAADALQKYQSAEAFAALCDLVPDTSGIVDSGRINTWRPETRLSHAYAMALQFSQVYNVEPDEETKRKIDRWRSLLQETVTEIDLVTEEPVEKLVETELVKKYREKMFAYMTEVLTYNNARISALSGIDQQAVHTMAINGPVMQLKIRAAENDWISNGFRDEYDRINAAIAGVEGRSFALLKQRYKEDFFRSLLTSPSSGANFLYTAPTPADFARSGSGWSEFYFNSSSYASNHRYTSSNTRGRSGFGIGPFKIGGSGAVERSDWEGSVNTDFFSLRMKLARVPIYRPAINLAFLRSGFWRFDKQNELVKDTLLSNGTRPPDGLMPAISTDCIFVKDLVLDFGEANRAFREKHSSTAGGGGISWGPFHLGGRHANKRDERNYEANWTDQGVHIAGLQLIGFLCYMLPLCPNPDSSIPEEAWA